VLNRRGLVLLAGACVAVFAGAAAAENWPQWRGPFFNGSTTETNLPATWTETRNVAWTAPMSGLSGSTPIVWGDRIFLSSTDRKARTLLAICLDGRTGKESWRHVVGKGRAIPRNNMASASPITDGKRVFFLYGTGDMVAYDVAGKQLWKRNLEDAHGPMEILFGYSNSPLLYKGRLYVVVMRRNRPIRPFQPAPPRPWPSYLLAIDPATGKDQFKHVRPTDALKESQESYTTPMPYEYDGVSQIILFGGDYLTGHDPDTGKEIWRWGTYNPRKWDNWRVVTSPLVTKDLIYVSSPKKAFPQPLFAIRTGARGRVGPKQVAWTHAPHITDAATPLLYRGRLYVLDGDDKALACLEPKTGRQIWQAKIGGRTVWRASPTGADGKIYLMSERGEVLVLAAGDSFKVLHKADMGGNYARSSIVAANGQLLIRTAKQLFCIRKGK